MPPQKRKHPHETVTDPLIPDATVRRSTRQRPGDGGAEPELQLRSSRLRAHAHPAVATLATATTMTTTTTAKTAVTATKTTTIQTRTTKQKATSQSEPETSTLATSSGPTSVSPAFKENVRPPSPSTQATRRVVQSKQLKLPKQSRRRVHSHSRSRSPPRSTLRPSSPSQSRVLGPRRSQQPPLPTLPALAIPITPKRTTSNKNTALTPKPPGTPRTDRNIDRIVFGNICFRAWYPSYYGKDVLGDASAHTVGASTKLGGGKRQAPMLDRLYICPCCFKYSKEMIPWWHHVRYCENKAFVPGSKIYTHPRRPQTSIAPHLDSASTHLIETARAKGKRRSDFADQLANETTINNGEWSVWEVDGEKDGIFCQNLSLFAKLFLDNKSVFFDVTGFNYFLLVYTPTASETIKQDPGSPKGAHSATQPIVGTDNIAPSPSDNQIPSATCSSPRPRPQIVGFFSKEKMSWDNNNLACILVFPPWQRKGLGALLMGVSYEISRREGVLGGPEKPISDLGYKGYKRFWAGEITRWILGLDLPASSTDGAHAAKHVKREREKDHDRVKDKATGHEVLIVDVEQCSRDTWIVPEDCLTVLREMGVVEEAGSGPPIGGERNGDRGGSAEPHTHGKEKDEKEPQHTAVTRVRINKAAVRRWALENKIDLTRACDPAGFAEGYAIPQAKEDEGEE